MDSVLCTGYCTAVSLSPARDRYRSVTTSSLMRTATDGTTDDIPPPPHLDSKTAPCTTAVDRPDRRQRACCVRNALREISVTRGTPLGLLPRIFWIFPSFYILFFLIDRFLCRPPANLLSTPLLVRVQSCATGPTICCPAVAIEAAAESQACAQTA